VESVNEDNIRVFFVVAPFQGGGSASYQQPIIALAEGLKEKGVYMRANHNYWYQKNKDNSSSYLLQEKDHDEDYSSFNVIVVGWLPVSTDTLPSPGITLNTHVTNLHFCNRYRI
tara:strand:- start:66 stop:407 length:342 start_codon:yes stop_codon:yes gene_type:complete